MFAPHPPPLSGLLGPFSLPFFLRRTLFRLHRTLILIQWYALYDSTVFQLLHCHVLKRSVVS